jgi:alpha-L-fucosidase 2
MDYSKKLWFDQEAKRFVEALPLGNGKLGAMDYGNGLFSLNEKTLWSGYPKDDFGIMDRDALRKSRKLIQEGYIEDAEKIIQTNLQGDYKSTYLPLGQLQLLFDQKPFQCSYRELDLETGSTLSQNSKDQLFSYISHKYNIGLIQYTGKKQVSLNWLPFLEHGSFESTEDHYFYKLQCPSKVPSYEEGHLPIEYDHKQSTVKAVLVVEKRVTDDGLVFLWTILTNYVDGGKVSELSFNQLRANALDHLSKASSLEDISQEHRNHMQALFSRSTLSLPHNPNSAIPTDQRRISYRTDPTDGSLISLYYHYGRYLLYSSSWKTSLPSNLQGLWNEELRAPWCSNYTTNINLEMNYWPAKTSRIHESYESLEHFLVNLSSKASNHGLVFHHNLDAWLSCSPAHGSPSWAFWPMAPVWLSFHLFDHLEEGEAKTQASIFNYLDQVALFLDGWLFQGDDGYYHTCPSTSPENQYVLENGYIASVSDTTTMDQMLIGSFCQKYQQFRSDSSIAHSLREKVNQLPPIPIHPEGYLQEWQGPVLENDIGHRHVSHLVGFFPDDFAFSLGPDYVEAGKKALHRRVADGGDFTSWHCTWIINLFARFQEPGYVRKYLDIMIGELTCPNLFSSHRRRMDGDELFQIDGNFGGTRAITEMFVHEINDHLHILPVGNLGFGEGKLDSIALKKGHLVYLVWGKTIELTIQPAKSHSITITYQKQTKNIGLTLGQEIRVTFI